jgi:hypothetical protein
MKRRGDINFLAGIIKRGCPTAPHIRRRETKNRKHRHPGCLGIGWLDAGAVERWRRGQIVYLERVVQANLKRISEAMKLFRA